MSDETPESLIPYDEIVQEALRDVVGRVLARSSDGGLPGGHHFYITFKTRMPGVVDPQASGRALPGRDDDRHPAPLLGPEGRGRWLLASACRSAACRRRWSCRSPRSPIRRPGGRIHPEVPGQCARATCTRNMTRPRMTRPGASRPRTARTSSASTSRGRNRRRMRSPSASVDMTARTTMADAPAPKPTASARSRCPADSYWGAQTERSIANFPFGAREQMPVEIVHALGFVKQAAARVNARLGAARRRRSPKRSSRRPAKSRAATSTASSRWSSGRPGRAPSRT